MISAKNRRNLFVAARVRVEVPASGARSVGPMVGGHIFQRM
jgi:hypothetical protein